MKMSDELFALYYLSAAYICAFDGEGGDGGGEGGDGGGEGGDGGGEGGAGGADGNITGDGDGKTFTQEDVNKFLADDRRKHQARLKEMESKLNHTLQSKGLSDEERSQLEESLDNMRTQLLTKEEQAKAKQKKLEDQYKTELEKTKEVAQTWESRYRDSTIERSLQDAAIAGEAFNPSQIMGLLKPNAKLVEVEDGGGFKPVVDFPTTNDAGESVVLQLSPTEAVDKMRELPETFGNLFKGNVVPGIGSNSSTGGVPGKNGKVDLVKLAQDPVAYRKYRKENPSLA